MRVGLGTSLLAPDPKRLLVLGGVKVPGAWGLKGRGDADALLQAVADALLGAAALGDLEDHAPAADPAWREAPSAVLLADVVETLAGLGLAPAHVDATVLAERAPLREHRDGMRERLAALLGLAAAHVNVKASTQALPSGAGGVAVWAVASLREVPA